MIQSFYHLRHGRPFFHNHFLRDILDTRCTWNKKTTTHRTAPRQPHRQEWISTHIIILIIIIIIIVVITIRIDGNEAMRLLLLLFIIYLDAIKCSSWASTHTHSHTDKEACRHGHTGTHDLQNEYIILSINLFIIIRFICTSRVTKIHEISRNWIDKRKSFT